MKINKRLLLTICISALFFSSMSAWIIPGSTATNAPTQYMTSSVETGYNVYMHENGLPMSSVWSVTVSGITYTSSSDLITFSLQYGEYNFTAATRVSGFSWDSAYNNTFFVNTSGTNVSVYFTQNQYIGNLSVQSTPEGIAFDSFNNYVYVSNDNSNSVSVISPSNRVVQTIPDMSGPLGVTFDPFNHYVYVIEAGTKSVSVLNQSNVVIMNISDQRYPCALAFDPYNDYVYVINQVNNTVSVINQSNVMIMNISVQIAPLAIAFDPYNDYIYVANAGSNSVSVINQSNVVVKNISVKYEPHGLAFDPYNDYIYVANAGSNSVSVINQSNVVVKNISVEYCPVAIGFDSYNDYIYVDSYLNNSVSVINQSNVVVMNIPVQSNPYAIAFDPYNDYIYVANSGSGTVSILSSTTGIAFYNVLFKESNLPSKTEWNLSIGGRNFSSNSNEICIPLTESEYTFHASASNDSYFPVAGKISVSNNQIVNLQFQQNMYEVNFTESGLPSATTWYLNLSNGQSFHSTTNTISFLEPNGTYHYTVSSMKGRTYSLTPSSGNFTISGANQSTSITFTEVTFQVTFNETGLPSGTSWYVNISEMASSGPINTASYTVYLTNGTYNYMIATPDKSYEPSSASSSVEVNGASQNVSITFSELMYQVTFNESGLPSGTTWYLNLSSGQSFHSTMNTISFLEPNGTYHYTVSSMKGRTYSSTPSIGKFTISGSAYSSSVAFSEVKYQITFTESGLPSGTTWYIAVDNSSLYEASQSNNLIDLPNGTYYITAMSRGYSSSFTGNSTHIIITVNGSSITVNLTFTKISSVVTSKPSSSNDLFIAIGTAAGIIAGIAAGFFVFRKKN